MTAPLTSAASHSLDAEQAVLGALLIDSAAWHRIAGRLAVDDFHCPEHRVIFAGIGELISAGVVADVVTLSELLGRRGELKRAGGQATLMALARNTPTSANVDAYAAVVRDRSQRRKLSKFASDFARAISDSSAAGSADLVSQAQEQLLAIQSAGRTGTGLISSRELAGELLDDLDREAASGLRLGLADLDALTHGLEGGDLVVIAGRPGMGKTALLVTVAAHVAESASVAVFSAEMPRRQLMRRCLALTSGISQARLRPGGQLTETEWGAISPATSTLAQRRLWIDDASAPTMTHVRSECFALKARAGLALVVIDYVQLLQGRGANRYEQLRDVAYGCKALAKDLAVPVILLAQLNRGVEARDHKRPYLSDLRDSGAIEEAADIVGLLYSEGYYDAEFGMPYVLECRIEKHRNGERGECLWRFAGEYSRVTVLEPGAAAQYRQLRAKRRHVQRGGSNDDL